MFALNVKDFGYIIVKPVSAIHYKEVLFCEAGDIKLSFSYSMIEHVIKNTIVEPTDLDLFYTVISGYYVPLYNNGRFV